MLGILVDMAMLIIIVSVLARENLAEERFRFGMCALAIAVAGIVLQLTGMPAILFFLCYYAVSCVGLKLVVGTTWIASAVAAAIFVGLKVALAMFLYG